MASISKRGDYWQIRISYKDSKGTFRTKNKSGFHTKKEAKLFANEFEIKASTGELITNAAPLFSKYFYDWYKTYKMQSVRERTQATYLQAYHVIQKYLPTSRIDELDRKSYQKFITEYGSTHSKATVSKMNSLFHACVKDAVYDGAIKKDFVATVQLVFDNSKTREVEYLSESDLKTLTAYLAKTRNVNFTSKYMILTAFYTGMRPGEVGGLRWDDIDFKAQTFSLHQSWNETTKDFEPLKNKSSYRVIPVNKWLLDIINELPHNDAKDRVFVNQYGTIPTSRAVNNVIKDSLSAVGLKR
ncbi:tyrosine-type recombinase/integrase [Pediococcus parvulus]|uniref:site-specific integrase n=1 Tax=Pediococcus parvulus TaxID=54062 RepID=UPI003757D2C8